MTNGPSVLEPYVGLRHLADDALVVVRPPFLEPSGPEAVVTVRVAVKGSSPATSDAGENAHDAFAGSPSHASRTTSWALRCFCAGHRERRQASAQRRRPRTDARRTAAWHRSCEEACRPRPWRRRPIRAKPLRPRPGRDPCEAKGGTLPDRHRRSLCHAMERRCRGAVRRGVCKGDPRCRRTKT